MTLRLFYTPSSGGRERFLDWQVLPVQVDSGGSEHATVSVLAPDSQVGMVGSGTTPTIRLHVD